MKKCLLVKHGPSIKYVDNAKGRGSKSQDRCKILLNRERWVSKIRKKNLKAFMDSPRSYNTLLPFFAFAIFMIFIMTVMKVNHGNFTAFIS